MNIIAKLLLYLSTKVDNTVEGILVHKSGQYRCLILELILRRKDVLV
jgi:hypothetical protein